MEGREAMDLLERWVTEHQSTVFRAAYLVLRDPDAAQDVAQETFLRAWRAADRPDGATVPSDPEGIRPWLYRIAVNTAINLTRKRKREMVAVARLDRNHTVADPTDGSDTAEVVGEAIDRLPDKLRVTIICRYFLDMSEREIANTLRIRPGTVKSRLYDARQRLASDEDLALAANG